MLKPNEKDLVFQCAYVPEHLIEYVTAVTGGKPHLFQDYLCYRQGNHLTFIGYPFSEKSNDLSRAFPAACEQFQPHSATLVAADLSGLPEGDETLPADRYYRLDLPIESLHSEVAYMVRRAARELEISAGQFGREHKKIIKKFIGRQALSAAQIHIFQHVSNYLKRSKTAHLFEARKSGNLVAFSIVDLGSARYAFYQFNFRSPKWPVPGASDLLLDRMVRMAQAEGKLVMNLGLGVHAGIRRFKEKWGGRAFLEHRSMVIHRQPAPDFSKLVRKL
jgi:hypothetical protein